MDELAERRRQQFAQASEAAEKNWTPRNGGATERTVYVNAEAKTGSRYAVVVSELPIPAVSAEGGQWLVTVVQPWQAAYPVGSLEPIDLSYVLEKFCRQGSRPELVHGGDAKALQLTINFALQKFTEWTGLARISEAVARSEARPEEMPYVGH